MRLREERQWPRRGKSTVRHRLAATSILLSGLALCGGPAVAEIRLSPALEQMYALSETESPTAEHMTVCYGFRCRLRLSLVFTPDERKLITNLMSKGRASAPEERKAIQQVFVWFDHRVAREAGTHKRVAYADIRAMDADRNFDCWDTTRNAASLLLILQEWGLLRHHIVADPRYRGNILIGQLPHNTAVLKETAAGGTSWVVDMWTTRFGQVPDVMPLDKWLREI
jgi:hypothetical protein